MESLREGVRPGSRADGLDWRETIGPLVNGYLEADQASRLSPGALAQFVRKLHCTLLDHPCFTTAWAAATECRPKKGIPYCSEALVDDQVIRVGLLTLFRALSVPIHDHPGAYGARLVLSGTVRIRQFETRTDPMMGRGLLTMEQSNELTLSHGQVSSYTPTVANIHDVKATTASAVLLVARLSPCSEAERGWYIPLEAFRRQGSEFFARRVCRRPGVARADLDGTR